MIKNIVFDLGGVLLTDDDAGFLFENEELLTRIAADKETLEVVWNKHWKDVGEKRLTITEFYNVLQDELTGTHDEEFSKRLFEIYKEKTTSLPLLETLPILSKNYNLYSLTNIFSEGLAYKREKYELDKYFKFIAASCDVGLSKPDSKIFDYLINTTKIIASETVFVDDRDKNILAARAMGFNAIKCSGYESVMNGFKDLDINNG